MVGGTLERLKNGLARLFASKEARRHGLVGSPRLWKMRREFQFDFLKRMGLEHGHHLLDLGCSGLRGSLPLIEFLEAGHYTGIEARGAQLEEGRARLREAGLERKAPVLLQADPLDRVELATRFDVIWAFSVLIHADDAAVESALRLVARSLAANGSFYANVRIGERAES